MRADLLEALLEQELQVCAEDESLSAARVRIWRHAALVYVRFESGRDGKPGIFRLDCSNFDALPPSVAMVDENMQTELNNEQWTAGVPHGIHPITGKPFVCLQGVAEYHNHPSHLDDSWDRYRNRYRLRQTIIGLLRKAGAI